MNALRQIKLKLQIRIKPVIKFGSELLRDMWQQVSAEREARIKLMTDGYLTRHYESRTQESTTLE